jgi:PAS domain S-box-containing protein
MLTCLDAMVLTDRNGKIVHCNREYADLTGYTLKDIEGLDNATLLSGSMTDFAEMRRCSGLHKLNQNSSMCVVNYRKDGSMFANLITTVPVFGSYSTHGKIIFI